MSEPLTSRSHHSPSTALPLHGRVGHPRRVLILKPSSLGDVIQALPVLRLIKRQFPQTQAWWWIDSRLAPLLEGDPDLAGLVPFERRGWGQPANWAGLWRTIRWLRAQRFDWVIDLQSLARSGTLAWLANGALSVGMDTPREGARGFYDIAIRRRSFHTHAVDWYREVLRALGVSQNQPFDWLPPRPGAAASLRHKWDPDGGPWVILQPGARWLNKRWPIEYFSRFIDQVGNRVPRARFAILGGAEDQTLGAALTAATSSRCIDLTGKLSLPEMVECLRLGTLMITNDTGPMHVAAALGKPMIALFGPTEPRRTGPYGQLDNTIQAALPCIPCMRHHCHNPRQLECLTAITPETVAQRAVAHLSRHK